MDFYVKNKEKERYERIRLNEIIYVETGGAANIIIHSEHGSYKFSTSLSAFIQAYQSTDLVQLHQSYIVNWEKVIAVTPSSIFVVAFGEEKALRVGRLPEYRDRFSSLVNKLKSE